jgi:trimeric autotransporter adhesin
MQILRKGSAMKALLRIGLFLFLFSQLALCGIGQRGIITTYVGPGLPAVSAQANTQAIDDPGGVISDNAGGFYVSSRTQKRIYRVAADGSLSLTAGIGSNAFSGHEGPAIEAQLSHPEDLAVDSEGNLFIADIGNHRIRKATARGIILTVAGNGTRGYSGDGGPATAAQFKRASGLALDSAGNLYIADSGNHRIRRVTPEGIISTVAGNETEGQAFRSSFSGDGGIAAAASLNGPLGVAVDSAGNLYIADTGNNRVRKVTK